MTYRLFYSPGACSMAVHIVLEEIGAPYDLELVSSRGEREGAMTATDEWRAINPKGRIPALLGVPGSIGGGADLLTEVPAILYFLAARHSEAALLPEHPAPAARCFEWCNWLSGAVHGQSYGQIWRAQRFSADEAGLPAIRDQGRRNLADQYAYVERLIGDGRTWAVPERYTIVDPYLLVFFHWGERIGLPMRVDYPVWSAWADRVIARPAVRKVLEAEAVVISPPH